MHIVKVPGINGLGKTNGCEKSPNEILRFLKEISVNEKGREVNFQNLDLEEIHLDNSNLKSANELIYKNSFGCFGAKPRTIFLGGDHSISYSLTKAFFDFCKSSGRVSQIHSASSMCGQSKEPCLIVFDAHPDLMPPMKEPTHEEWLRKLVEGGFPGENILIVGAREIEKGELKFLKKSDIKTISLNRFEENLEDACDTIMEFANGKELYVSIDIDVIDPVFAPATGYPVPGGFSSRQFLYLISRINKIKNLRAVDIVEINSEKDESNLTVKLGAKILAELL